MRAPGKEGAGREDVAGEAAGLRLSFLTTQGPREPEAHFSPPSTPTAPSSPEPQKELESLVSSHGRPGKAGREREGGGGGGGGQADGPGGQLLQTEPGSSRQGAERQPLFWAEGPGWVPGGGGRRAREGTPSPGLRGGIVPCRNPNPELPPNTTTT